MTETFPDYSFLIEDELSLLDPDFDVNTFLNQFKLESVVYIGRLRCELVINSSIYDTVVFWAPEEYYLEHSKVAIGENEILMDESLSILENIEVNFDLSLNFSYASNNITISTQVGNFVDFEDVLTSRVVSRSWSRSEGEKYLFLLSETFEDLFGDFFENLTIQYLPLFEFSEAIISSYLPHKLDDFLVERRIELDSYFDYTYDSTNSYERNLRTNSLEWHLSNFNDNFKEYTWSRVAVFYIICFGISAVVITNTSRGFFKSQKERIEFYYLRGSKKSDLLYDFLKLETKLAFYVLLGGFLVSTLIMGVLQPKLLASTYNHVLNLLVNCITAIIYCSIQFVVSADSLSMIYRRNEKKEKFLLNKIIIAFKNGLQWIILCIALAVSLYLYLFTGIEKVEKSAVFLYIFTLVIALILLLVISKRTIVWIGEKFISLLNSLSSISKYTLKVSKKVIRVNSLVIQMLILFGFICSFFVVGLDTINHYNYINQQNNAIGEIIINYPEENAELVKTQLANFTAQYFEIEYVVSPLDFVIDVNTSIASGLTVFLLNSSTIAQFFNSDIVKKKYSGSYEPTQLVTDLNTDWNLSIINRAYADQATIQLGETTELPLPIIVDPWVYPEDLYNITILDIVEFVPFFSGISQEKPFVLLNKEITQNRTKIDVISLYQILWLNENSSVENLEEYILDINREFNLGIEIYNLDEKSLFTDEYWLPNVLQTLILSLFTVLMICLIFLFFVFYVDVIRFQIHNFRTFFARGLSIKKGIIYSVLPVFLFTLGYIIFGFVLGVSLLSIVLTTIQPEYYLRIPVAIFPYSFLVFIGQITLLCCALFLASLISYKKLQQQIPTIDRIVFTVFKDEGGII
ncbi:MAG: hypothetical protein GPJ51_08905 [Candidatus Heimdallarchaeota archaeon]|nr:hypothetical protein [Candidatus Heimdallarchaeota archaeon]